MRQLLITLGCTILLNHLHRWFPELALGRKLFSKQVCTSWKHIHEWPCSGLKVIKRLGNKILQKRPGYLQVTHQFRWTIPPLTTVALEPGLGA